MYGVRSCVTVYPLVWFPALIYMFMFLVVVWYASETGVTERK